MLFRGVSEAIVGGFSPNELEDAGGIILLPLVALKKGYISYRTVQLHNID
jgi:hypothetical protein